MMKFKSIQTNYLAVAILLLLLLLLIFLLLESRKRSAAIDNELQEVKIITPHFTNT
jgi:hypothetical protein